MSIFVAIIVGSVLGGMLATIADEFDTDLNETLN